MAYTPNKDRAVKNGIAQVSAQELADFRKQYGEKSTLRDLLNADKGLSRKGEKTVYPQVTPVVKNQVSPDTVRNLASKSNVKMYANDFERNKGMSDDTYNPDVKKSASRVSPENQEATSETFKRGGKVGASKMGSVKTSKPAMSSASRRADGIATKGKTRGRFV